MCCACRPLHFLTCMSLCLSLRSGVAPCKDNYPLYRNPLGQSLSTLAHNALGQRLTAASPAFEYSTAVVSKSLLLTRAVMDSIACRAACG